MDIKYGRNLVKGDLIGVAYNNYIWPAIYAGQGSKNNSNFWLVTQILNAKRAGQIPIYKGYIMRHDTMNSSPIVKINPADLTNIKDQQDYLEASQFLKQNGYI